MMILSLMMDKYYTSKLEISKDTNEQKDLCALNDNIWIYSLILSGAAVIYHIFMNLNKMKELHLFEYKNITLFVNIIISFLKF